MATKAPKDPWGDFWALNTRSGKAARGEMGGCLPKRWAAIEGAQRAAWLGFISELGPGSRVLDLATGDGRVLRWMREKRSDLSLEGIDLAPELPPAPAGTRTQGGVAMEDLPFDGASFDAVVSQFGFEYGDVAKVASEIARVLSGNGRVGLMMHRGDGPILAHNRKRRNELLWALKEKAAARRTRTVLKDGPAAIDKAAKLAGKIAAQGLKKFGPESPAWEIPEAIRRSCVMGRHAGVESIADTIAMIEHHAENELGRIHSLSRACKTADSRRQIVDSFESHGLALVSTESIDAPSEATLADFVIFTRVPK